MDHRIAPLPLHQLLDDLHRDLGAELADQIDGVGAAPVGGKDLIDPRDQLRGEIGDRQAVLHAEVGGDDPPAAAQGHHGDPVAAGKGKGGEGGREVEEVHRLLHDDDPRLAGGGVEDPDVRGERPGVARGGAVPRLGAAPLEHDDGLLFPHAPGGLEEAPAVLDAFQVEDDRLRQLIDLEGLHVILDRDHRLVSRTAEGADADPLVFGKTEELHPEIPRLGDERGGPGLGPDVRSAAEEGVVGIADPHRVGAEDQDARLPRLPDQFLLQAPPLGARFGESGGDQEHVLDPLFLQLGDQIEDLRRRDGHDGQIDRPRDLPHRLEGRPAGDLARPWR